MEIKVGQVYRLRLDVDPEITKDYGDIHRWKVAVIGRKVAVLTNLATDRDTTLLDDELENWLLKHELVE